MGFWGFGDDAKNRRQPDQASEHGDGLKPTTKTEAAAKQLQPCTAHSGESAS